MWICCIWVKFVKIEKKNVHFQSEQCKTVRFSKIEKFRHVFWFFKSIFRKIGQKILFHISYVLGRHSYRGYVYRLLASLVARFIFYSVFMFILLVLFLNLAKVRKRFSYNDFFYSVWFGTEYCIQVFILNCCGFGCRMSNRSFLFTWFSCGWGGPLCFDLTRFCVFVLRLSDLIEHI